MDWRDKTKTARNPEKEEVRDELEAKVENGDITREAADQRMQEFLEKD